MFFRVVTQNPPVPIFEQIRAQVIFGVAAGSLRPGELIPSVRELAHEVTVHPNTVAKAYQELEKEKVLVTRRGKGMEVSAEAPALCRVLRREIVSKRLQDALQEAVSSALSAEEIRRIVDEELARLNGQVR
jgi:GntR family transcriptional regulator